MHPYGLIILGVVLLATGIIALEHANSFPPINIGGWDEEFIAKAAMWFVVGCITCAAGVAILAVKIVEVIP